MNRFILFPELQHPFMRSILSRSPLLFLMLPPLYSRWQMSINHFYIHVLKWVMLRMFEAAAYRILSVDADQINSVTCVARKEQNGDSNDRLGNL